MRRSSSRNAISRRGLLALVAVIVAVLCASSTAWAAASHPALRLVARQAPHDRGAVELIATLQMPASVASSRSASLAGAEVSFSVHLSQFSGAPLLTLGTATTDAAGVAALVYRPTWTGRQALVATAASAAGTTLASATASFAATSATHPFAGTVQAVRPNGVIGQWVTGVLLAIVATLWITLIAVVVRVNLGFVPGRKRASKIVAGDEDHILA